MMFMIKGRGGLRGFLPGVATVGTFPTMKPVAVIPMNDPMGVFFPHLQAVTPTLKNIFERVFVSVTAVTYQQYPQHITWLQSEPFYDTIIHEQAMSVGDDFLTLYAHAAQTCQPTQIMHLCFIDRVVFALQTEHRQAFVADIGALLPVYTPLIFQRSLAAWKTHPRNYQAFEQMVRTTGEWLLGQSLDFAWCHLAVQAGQLRPILPRVQRRDFGFLAEIVLFLREDMQLKDVDWLAWEDPFILGQDAEKLKVEREYSVDESLKRLSYVSGMLAVLQTAVSNNKNAS